MAPTSPIPIPCPALSFSSSPALSIPCLSLPLPPPLPSLGAAPAGAARGTAVPSRAEPCRPSLTRTKELRTASDTLCRSSAAVPGLLSRLVNFLTSAIAAWSAPSRAGLLRAGGAGPGPGPGGGRAEPLGGCGRSWGGPELGSRPRRGPALSPRQVPPGRGARDRRRGRLRAALPQVGPCCKAELEPGRDRGPEPLRGCDDSGREPSSLAAKARKAAGVEGRVLRSEINSRSRLL